MCKTLLLVGILAAAISTIASPKEAAAAARRSWSPFVLVVGPLLAGLVAHRDGLFDRVVAATSRLRIGGRALFVARLGLVATVTAVLNLDAAVPS